MNIGKAPLPQAAGSGSFGAPVERAATGTSAGARDSNVDSTKPTFGESWKKIQAEYGAKAEKPREIKKTLGKDDFLKIMVTQMQHQDPTAPFKAEQMAQQMAQYTSVEQLQNMNSKLERMTTANQPLERMAMTGLIGKTVTVDKERFPHTEGNKTTLGFEMPKDAAQVSVSIVGPTGETVFTKDLGAMKKGSQNYVWEGIQANSLPAKAGNYQFVVSATDKQGAEIKISSKGQSRVVGVSFEGKEPALLIGDPLSPQKILMGSVVRIDSDGGGMIPGAGSLAAASGQADAHAVAQSMNRNRMAARNGDEAAAAGSQPADAPAQGGNYFRFQKGVGSETLDKSNLGEEASRALAAYEAQRAQALQAQGSKAPQDQGAQALGAGKGAGEEAGFPNGLNN